MLSEILKNIKKNRLPNSMDGFIHFYRVKLIYSLICLCICSYLYNYSIFIYLSRWKGLGKNVEWFLRLMITGEFFKVNIYF